VDQNLLVPEQINRLGETKAGFTCSVWFAVFCFLFELDSSPHEESKTKVNPTKQKSSL
jgi:hypothetical protein